MKKKTIYLICNAHLDPVWLWNWREGVGETLSTFRVAADCCEAYDGFIFNHNESLLYAWIEEHDPALFERIERLVREGKWHIMGGWLLQPDCNMPSGESLVRQILVGRHFFRNRFGVEPTTAINFDPFGHSRGLVQIMAKSGYDTYLFWRPEKEFMELPYHEFRWIGHDGSEIVGSRSFDCYNNRRGEARKKIETRLKDLPPEDDCYLLWGAGNHGGGPTRQDLDDISALMQELADSPVELRHATAEQYAARVQARRERLPEVRTSLNPWGPGCYTSQIRIKQFHRRLEGELFSAEKMAAAAALHGRLPWPAEELRQAQWDLLFCEFHDILPGSAIEEVEEDSLRTLCHGLEICDQVKTRAFFALADDQPAAAEGTYPILVFNPHPFTVKTEIDCEFTLDRRNKEGFMLFDAGHDGERTPCQVEWEASNVPFDWRKRVVFDAELPPSQMSRVVLTPRRVPERPAAALVPHDGAVTCGDERAEFRVNMKTGWIDRYRCGDAELLRGDGIRAIVLADSSDPWGGTVTAFREVAGAFELASPQRAAEIAGARQGELPPVQVIEDGPVRSVIEAIFTYGESALVVRYLWLRQAAELELDLRVHWKEPDAFLKLSLPVAKGRRLLGEVAYGVDELFDDGREAVAQRWVAVKRGDGTMLTCINDGVYGCDFADGELRLSLLRSAAYSALFIEKPPCLNDRFHPRIDQGQRRYRFWLKGGPAEERLSHISREATVRHQPPLAVPFYPDGRHPPRGAAIEISGECVEMTALKRAEDGNGFIVRLFNPTDRPQDVTVSAPSFAIAADVTLGPYEISTHRLVPEERSLGSEALMESDRCLKCQ